MRCKNCNIDIEYDPAGKRWWHESGTKWCAFAMGGELMQGDNRQATPLLESDIVLQLITLYEAVDISVPPEPGSGVDS